MLTLRPGGALIPTSLASASAGPIELRVVSDDAHQRRVVLRASTPQTLTVPAHGHASMLVTGLGQGRYLLEVDGRARAALLIGS
jgi:hypothetical protein